MQKKGANLLHFFELYSFFVWVELQGKDKPEFGRNPMEKRNRSLLIVLALIAAASAALAFVTTEQPFSGSRPAAVADVGGVTVDTRLVQDKILAGSDGRVSVALTLTAPERAPLQEGHPPPATDLVVVLDRSGSMSGRKIVDARHAVQHLIDRLLPRDRLALVTYSNGVRTLSPLVAMGSDQRVGMQSLVAGIRTGGGTNLGAGLQAGLDLLAQRPEAGRQRRLILVSDGHANQGITRPEALGLMVAGAVENRFAVSTVGVGYDFNEVLMTTIADHGAGRYHFLEDPAVFAAVFEEELAAARTVAASALRIRIPLEKGVRLLDVGGYPVHMEGDVAVIHPGDLLAGQQRRFFLTFAVPADRVGTVELPGITVAFESLGMDQRAAAPPLVLACVEDAAAVTASIDREQWGEQVVQDGYSRLQEEVAGDIREGKKTRALQRIREYESRNEALNARVGSRKVAENLDKDVSQLRTTVEDTFAGAPAAVAEKQKVRAKALQFDGYEARRAK